MPGLELPFLPLIAGWRSAIDSSALGQADGFEFMISA